MKELRLLLGIYIAIIILVVACTKTVSITQPPLSLGVTAAPMQFVTSPFVDGGNVKFTIQTTPGAKYSVQIVDISGDIKVKQGLTAVDTIQKISLPLDKIGAFDVIILDIKGNEIKQPIIKKI
jgi:hypothetical protein